jgi:hypothetical protein
MKLGVYMRHSRFYRWLAMSLLIGLGSVCTRGQDHQPEPSLNTVRTFVDLEVLISHDGDVVHRETYVSASVTDSDLLLAGGEVLFPGRGAGASEAQIYRSEEHVGAESKSSTRNLSITKGHTSLLAGILFSVVHAGLRSKLRESGACLASL